VPPLPPSPSSLFGVVIVVVGFSVCCCGPPVAPEAAEYRNPICSSFQVLKSGMFNVKSGQKT
jgi:hypothetical protein